MGIKPILGASAAALLSGAAALGASAAQSPDDSIADAVRDAMLDDQLETLRAAGVSEVPATALPPEIVEALGLDPAGLVPVETLVDPEFRAELAEIVADPELLREWNRPGAERPAPGRTVDDVLADLRPEDRELLAPHRALLDDEWDLAAALASMTLAERRAATRFLAFRLGRSEPPTFPGRDETLERWREQGYRDTTAPPRVSSMLAAVGQARAVAAERVDGDLLTDALAADGFFDELESAPLPRIPPGIAAPDAEEHVLRAPGHATRIVTRSVYGGAPVMFEQSEVDAFHPHDPNLTVAGHPANVAWTLHGDGAWSTTVAAYDGRRVHHVTVEAKLEGRERDDFVRFAAGLIEGAALLP